MIKTKLHNPIIANNSYIENVVIEKVDSSKEALFSNVDSTTPIIPENGRIWFNTDYGVFKFSNIDNLGNTYIDTFLSRTDHRIQNIAGAVNFNNDVTVNDSNNNNLIVIDTSSSNFTSKTNTVSFSVNDSLIVTNGTQEKIVANNQLDELDISYNSINLIGTIAVDGNMLISGDLTIGGQTTRVDIKSESLSISDNIIILNSNLDDNTDPRMASAIVDGTDVDHNAGVAVNRGSEGLLNLIQWVESTDTSSEETLKAGVSKVSIWNYEASTPSYELHQIIDAYTLARQVTDLSGSSKVGYDGEIGKNYQNAIESGQSNEEAIKISFKVDPSKLDDVIDSIVQEIDSEKFIKFDTHRIGETTEGTSFTITHNLNTPFIDVRIQREDSGKWFFDVLPIEIIDNNTIHIESTETTKIRFMISAINGFKIPTSDITII